MAEDKSGYSKGPSSITALKSKAMDLESGTLGKLFGSSKNAPINIAGLVLVVLLIPGIILLFYDGKIPATDYWKLVIPVITLIIGYIMGHRTS